MGKTEDQVENLVSLPKRFFGGLVDSIILWVSTYIVVILYLASQPYLTNDALIAAAPNATLLSLCVSIFFYVVVMWWSAGSTIGQLTVGARTVNRNGEKITFGQCFVRWLMSIVSSALLFLGYIAALFNDEKQTLHDMAASTVVISRRKQMNEDSQKTPTQGGISQPSKPTFDTDDIIPHPVTPTYESTQTPPTETQVQVSDEEAFEAAIDEFESEKIERGLYAKLYAESDGDEKKAKAEYLRVRAPALKIEIEKDVARLEYDRFKNLSITDKNQYILDLLRSHEIQNIIPDEYIIEITDELIARKAGAYYVLQSTSSIDELDGLVVFPLPDYTSIQCLKESKYKSTYVNNRLSFLLSNGRIAFLRNSNYYTYDAGGVPDPSIDFDKSEPIEIIDIKSYRLLS